MALSFVALPPKPHPAYNPHVYFLDSTLKALPAFRYIVQLFDAGTAVLLAELDIAPRPGDGFGYVDVSKLLQSQVSSRLEITNTTFYDADDACVYEYDIKFGETFQVAFSFDDYQFVAGGQFNGFTQLTNFAFVPHGLSVGDQILNTLTTVYGTVQDAVNGFYTVLDVPNAHTIVINLSFPGVGPLTPGLTTLAAGTSPRLLNLISDLGVVAWNRAYGFIDYTTWSPALVLPNTGVNTIQTSAPALGYELPDWAFLFWNFFDNNTNLIEEVHFVNDAGETFIKNTFGNTFRMKGVPCGPGNLGVLTPVGPAVLPLIKPNTLYYDVFGFSTTTGLPTTLSNRITIDRRCPINEIQILFLDRAGSWSSYPFTLRSRESLAVKRDEFRKELGNLGGGGVANQWGYTTVDTGLNLFAVEFDARYVLNTDYMTEEMSRYFAELITTADAYVQFETGGPFRGAIITDSAYEIQSRKNKRLIRNSITIKLAVDDQVNI